jgi:hypothetical protein
MPETFLVNFRTAVIRIPSDYIHDQAASQKINGNTISSFIRFEDLLAPY